MPSRSDSGTHDVINLMYVPGQTGAVRRFSVRRVWMRRAVGAAVGAAVVILLLGVDYVRLRFELSELDALRQETAEQGEEIRVYAQRMDVISQHLERMNTFDHKLRVITNLDPADGVPLRGIGGIEGDLLAPGDLGGLTRERRQKKMEESLESLIEATQGSAQSLETLVQHLEDQSAQLVHTPSIAPTRGWVTSSFGYRTSPFTGNREFHRGLDIAGRPGTVILAPADGVVTFTGQRRALGKTLTVRHGFGVETRYGHLADVLVKDGEEVQRGQKIALMGSSGRSTGPHLHYQVEVSGKPVNPQNYILD